MKKSRNLGAHPGSCLRWPLMLLAPFLLAHAAYAGTWSEPVYTVSARTPVDPRPESAFWPGGGGAAVDGPAIAAGGPDAGGTVFATFTYSSSGPADPVPTTLTLIESASASWGVTRVFGGGRDPRRNSAPSANLALFHPSSRPRVFLAQLQSGSSADNGMGDPEVPINPGPGGISEGFHVKTYPVANGKVVTDAVGLSAHCGQSNPQTRWSYSAERLFFSPSPDNIALDDGSTKGLNQYTIDVGILPTSISLSSSNDAAAEWLRTRSSWNLTGTAPALRPFADNFKSGNSVGPQHPSLATSTAPNPTPTPEQGLKFDVQTSASPSTTSNVGWNFPTDNTKFGVKTLNHVVGGTTVPAPVALFYPYFGFQHPTGGPPGFGLKEVHDSAGNVVHNQYGGIVYEVDISVQTPTPNYVYYYDKEWKNPWGIPVCFRGLPDSEYYPGDTFVQIGTDTHGLSGAVAPDTWLYATPPGGTFVSKVGTQKIRGLDLYARALLHECVHKRLFDALYPNYPNGNHDDAADGELNNNGIVVGDGVPDAIETQVGLNPTSQDTTMSGYGGDNEVFARMCERDYFSTSSQDWANDGFNFGKIAAPNARQRQVETYILNYTRNTFSWANARSLVP